MLLLPSCNFFEKTKEEEKQEREKIITKVDITIDTSNSFNSLFIDTAEVRVF
ncbi:hypothetical protein [Niabella hibiscisoli]|uniref:hypothetical protein n=1 Tax=Niabella hibiscisoli TaxID=1825928 RepID=UPI001F0DF109|nr:hypothetical protein [Niabella hibiscisoli]MCH5717634.1 hypothetical protein [Niabella hibiscisoli]